MVDSGKLENFIGGGQARGKNLGRRIDRLVVRLD